MNPEQCSSADQRELLPILKPVENRCIGCAFTSKDLETSQALRNLLESEGCLEDCPILHKDVTPPSSPIFPAHKSLS